MFGQGLLHIVEDFELPTDNPQVEMRLKFINFIVTIFIIIIKLIYHQSNYINLNKALNNLTLTHKKLVMSDYQVFYLKEFRFNLNPLNLFTYLASIHQPFYMHYTNTSLLARIWKRL